MERLREDILDLGQADGHVLIDGETGTGKTLVAHALHAVGAKPGRKFVVFSCASGDEATLARRIFGPMEEGGQQPVVEEARGGTIVLEDIDALPASLQGRLLTWINEQGVPAETRRRGDLEPAGAGQDLRGRAAPRSLLPARRAQDHRAAAARARRGHPDAVRALHRAVRRRIRLRRARGERAGGGAALQAPWPGNIRQLINIAERSVLQNRRGSGTIASLIMADNETVAPTMTTEGKPLKEYVEAFERMLIDNTMRRHKGTIAAVMDELCLPRRTLNEKMAKYGLQRSDYL
jgi:DNA-binding NtrC family response regulator